MNCMLGNQECSSGCDSGWTLYLEQSSISISPCDRENDSLLRRRNRGFSDARRSNDDDEDEDLSMVSDASSGPPHLHEEEEEEEEAFGGNGKNGRFYNHTIDRTKLKRNKNRENRCPNKAQDHSSLLDDTASSPFLDLCHKTRSQPSSVESVLEYSQGYSTTQFDQVRPPYQEHYDLFQSGTQLQQQNQWFEGKRW